MTPYPLGTADRLSAREAAALQREMRDRVVVEDRLSEVRRIAGLDVGYGGNRGMARGAVVVVDATTLAVVESAAATVPVRFPYVPGLLALREAPAVLAALERLSAPPDLLLVDGHGLAHPRRCGLACFLGVELALPAIGVAKSLLVGEHAPLPRRRGAYREIVDRGEVVGAALRTRSGVRPAYVSVGHLITLETAIGWVLGCCPRYRLPEPLRLADALSRCVL